MSVQSWQKPDGDDLVPDFVRETTGFLSAFLIYFGSPVLWVLLITPSNRLGLGTLLFNYRAVLHLIFERQNVFYLFHLIPALFFRYFFPGKNIRGQAAFGLALLLNICAVLVFFPVRYLLSWGDWQKIYLYYALYPLLMTFFTLRIKRLCLSGFVVLAVFLILLGFGFRKMGLSFNLIL